MRICPICEVRMEHPKCPTHDVKTVDAAVLEKDRKLAPGTMVAGRYRIERALGDGGYGIVYLAADDDQQVALKVLRQGLESDGRAIKRFYREAKAASSLDHPNIVRIFDFGVDEHIFVTYLVMEYVEGRTLQAIVRDDGPMTERRAAGLLLEVTRSLVVAHAQDVVHRDLKPANIMISTVDEEERAKVLDFGIAKILGDDSTKSLTHTGGALGTPAYMSPEQVNGNEVDFTTDLYSLGCLFHELLTGAPPYDSERALVVMYQQVNDPPPPLPKVLPCGDPPSSTAIALHSALLAKDPNARPVSTHAVADAFAALAEGRSAFFETKATLAPGVYHLVTAEPLRAARHRKIRNVMVLAGTALLALAGVTMWPASSQPLPPAPIGKPTKVRLTLDTDPPGALISIDGRPQGTTPQKLELPADGGTKTVVFEKAGYLGVEQRVVTDTSHSIKVVLKPSGETKRAAPRSKPQRKLKTTR